MGAIRMRILVIDVGGTHVKLLATGHNKFVEIPTGPKMTPGEDDRLGTRHYIKRKKEHLNDV